MPNEFTPRIAIIGWCDRAARIEGVHPALTHTNIQGLTTSRVSHIFPLSIRGITLLLCMYDPKAGESFSVKFRHSDGTWAFDITMNLTAVQNFDPERKEYSNMDTGSQMPGWHFQTDQVSTDVLILRPDTLSAFLVSNGEEQFLGSFNFLHGSLPPYSADQIAALRSDPLARRIIRATYRCTECGAKLQTYAGLERNKVLEDQGWSWFAELGEHFRCDCGKLSFSLQYLLTGLHGA